MRSAPDPDTPARELRLRTEAISPALAEHARRHWGDRIGLSCSNRPDGASHRCATRTPETVALRNALLNAPCTATAPTAAPAAPAGEGTTPCPTHSGTQSAGPPG